MKTVNYKLSEKFDLSQNCFVTLPLKVKHLMILLHYAAQVLIFELLLVHLVDYSAYRRKTKPSSAIKKHLCPVKT